jgi:hypothetical protein
MFGPCDDKNAHPITLMDSVRIIEESRNLYSKTSKLLFIYHDDDDNDDDIKNAPKTY